MYSPPSLGGIRPRRFGLVSWSPHVAFGYDLVADLRPRMLVELGTHSGESYFAFCQSVEENRTGTTCYAVDTWKGDPQAGFYGEDIYQDVAGHNQEFYASFSYLIRSSFDEALHRFSDGSLDLIHFDGLHTYDAVRHDFQTWQPKLSPRGVALFHDIAARHDDFGAWRFWEELREQGQSFEFHHGWGLGVWRAVGSEKADTPLLRSLFEASDGQAENIRHYYIMATDSLRQRRVQPEEPRALPAPKTVARHSRALSIKDTPNDDADGTTTLQVFFPHPETGFREEDSCSVPLLPGDWQRLEVPLPRDWRGQGLRLDPGNVHGLVEVAGVRIVSEVMGEVVWELLGTGLRDAAHVAGHARVIPDTRLLRVFCTGSDPQILLPDIELSHTDEPLHLEVGLCLRTDLISLSSVLVEGPSQELRTVQERVEHLEEIRKASDDHIANLEAIRAEQTRNQDNLAAELRTVREQAHALREAVLSGWTFLSTLDDELRTVLADTTKSAHELREQLRRARHQLQDTEEELDELREEQTRALKAEGFSRQEITSLTGELQTLTEKLAAMTQERDDIWAELEASRQQGAELRQSCALAQGRLASMRQSPSWKLTLPLRVVERTLTGKAPTAAKMALPVSAAPAPVVEANAAPTPEYRLELDEPTDWNFPSQSVRLRGWIRPLTPGQNLPRLRVRSGSLVTEAVCDVPRPDVEAALGGEPAWSHCGFDFVVAASPGPSELTIEALDAEGQTTLLRRHQVRAPYAAGARPGAVGDPATDYLAWIRNYDTLSSADRRRLRDADRRMDNPPLISVVMPTYNPPERWLIRAIDSVRRQTYPYWELCIADDCSTKPHVRNVLERYAHLDERIKVCFREQNGHISAASNSALALATGEYVALLDHDDELPAHALSVVAREVRAHPEAEVIYSDEDKIDEDDRRFSPYFKPDWNPDLLLGQNFISHLGVYRREAMEAVGGFRVGFEGCQDWDLALRIVEQIPAAHVRHIPRVLYHWRAIEGSTARAVEEKSYIVDASMRLLQSHLERTGQNAQVLPVPGNHFRVRYSLPTPAPRVSVIIPTHNQLGLLRQGIESLRRTTTYPNYEIVVVDNRSNDPATLTYLEELRSRGDARVLRYPQPFNYSALNNFAVRQTVGELVCLMNNDMEVITPDWLEEMASQALRPGIGVVGAALYYPDDTIQHAGVMLGLGGVAGHVFSRMPRGTDGYFNRARLVQNLTAVTAACLVVRRAVYEEVGGLNETLQVAFNDVDFCLKVKKAGYRNVWTPHAEFYHHESASRGIEDTPEKQRRFASEVAYMQAHWPDLIAHDPAYNPNLSLHAGDCRRAMPPRVPPLP